MNFEGLKVDGVIILPNQTINLFVTVAYFLISKTSYTLQFGEAMFIDKSNTFSKSIICNLELP